MACKTRGCGQPARGGDSLCNVVSWTSSSRADVGHGAAAFLSCALLKRFWTCSSACRFRYKFVQRSVITLPETWFDFLPSLSYLAWRRFKSHQIMKCYPLYSARLSPDSRDSRAKLQVAPDCKFKFWRYILPAHWLKRYEHGALYLVISLHK